MKSLLEYLEEMENIRQKNAIFEDEDTNKEDETSDEPETSDEEENDDDAIDMNGLILIKPGFLDKETEIRQRLESEGWDVVGEATKKFTEDEAKAFYSDKETEPYFDDLVEYMCSDDCKSLMLYKEEAAKPIEEIQTLKEKIRLELSEDDMKNVLHSSDSFENMEKELNIIMSDPEDDIEESEEPEDEAEDMDSGKTEEDTGEDTDIPEDDESDDSEETEEDEDDDLL